MLVLPMTLDASGSALTCLGMADLESGSLLSPKRVFDNADRGNIAIRVLMYTYLLNCLLILLYSTLARSFKINSPVFPSTTRHMVLLIHTPSILTFRRHRLPVRLPFTRSSPARSVLGAYKFLVLFFALPVIIPPASVHQQHL